FLGRVGGEGVGSHPPVGEGLGEGVKFGSGFIPPPPTLALSRQGRGDQCAWGVALVRSPTATKKPRYEPRLSDLAPRPGLDCAAERASARPRRGEALGPNNLGRSPR